MADVPITPLTRPPKRHFFGHGSVAGNTSALGTLLSPFQGSMHKARISGGLRPRLTPLRPLGAKREVFPAAGSA